VLCADKGGRVAVFEVASMRMLLTIRASKEPLLDAAFHPDGDSIVTADVAGVIRLWPIDPLPLAAERLRTIGQAHR
jgi:WD40 repeat protein